MPRKITKAKYGCKKPEATTVRYITGSNITEKYVSFLNRRRLQEPDSLTTFRQSY
jgi:hypothetical protein